MQPNNDNSKAVNQAETQAAALARAIQREVAAAVLSGLLLFAFDKGRSMLSLSNITASNRVALRVSLIAQQRRPTIVQRIVNLLLGLFDRNKTYFKEQGATPNADDIARRKLLMMYGYDIDTGSVVPGGYIDGIANMGGVAQQIGATLNRLIAGRATLADIRRTIRPLFLAQGGVVTSHFQRFTGDLFMEFDRAAKYEYKEQLGLTKGVYAGTAIDTSRRFCLERLNNVYDESEIDKWNRLDWNGKKPGDVRIVCGGYRCRHHINWVSDGVAKVIASRRGGMNNYNIVKKTGGKLQII